MGTASGRLAPDKWDIARLGSSHGDAGQATWAETFAARAFGAALIEQPEFLDQVRSIRAGASAMGIARGYVRRDQRRRVEAVAIFLRTAAAAEPHPREAVAKGAVLNVGNRAWWVDGPREPGQPQRNLRVEAIETIQHGAIRVARRGASRCAHPDCCEWRGTRLASDSTGDHCELHTWLDRRPRQFVEIDRVFFERLLPAVLDRRW